MNLVELLDAFRDKLATVATTRDPAKLFLRHTGPQPFRESPGVGYDGFAVSLGEWRIIEGFGIPGKRQLEAFVLVELGHAPFADSEGREDFAARDTERVADLLEANSWAAGVDAVFFDGSEIDRSNSQWWVSSIRFRVILWGDSATS